MKIEKISNQHERTILVGMIVDDTVLAQLSVKWERDMFKSRWANLIATWCTYYYLHDKKSIHNLVLPILHLVRYR